MPLCAISTTKDVILHMLSLAYNARPYDTVSEASVVYLVRDAGMNLVKRQPTSMAIEELLIEKKIVRLEFWQKDLPHRTQYLYMLATTRLVITNTVSTPC